MGPGACGEVRVGMGEREAWFGVTCEARQMVEWPAAHSRVGAALTEKRTHQRPRRLLAAERGTGRSWGWALVQGAWRGEGQSSEFTEFMRAKQQRGEGRDGGKRGLVRCEARQMAEWPAAHSRVAAASTEKRTHQRPRRLLAAERGTGRPPWPY